MADFQARLFILDAPAKREHLIRLLQKLPLGDGQIWDVRIKPYEARRSLDANRRLFALHKLASDETGHSVDELHSLMKWKFLPRKVVEVAGDKTEVSIGSSKLNKKDFNIFMTQVEEFYISTLGIFLGSEE